MIDKYIPFMILLALFVLFYGYILTKKILFLRAAVSTIGIVKKVGSESSENGASVYYQNVEFNNDQGKTFTVSSVMGSSSVRDSEGSAVKVLYLSDDPENAVINDFKNIWGLESIVFAIACVGLYVYFEQI